MASITHMAMCTKNNRRLARFYYFIFGMEEVWNAVQNSPYSFYIGDGRFQLNCLQIRPGTSYAKIVDGREVLPDPGIHHIGFQVDDLKATEKHFGELDPPIELETSPGDGRYEERRFTDPDGNYFELAGGAWDAGPARDTLPLVRHVSLCSPQPEGLAEFYKAALGMKELCRAAIGQEAKPAVYLSDGLVSLEIINDPGFGKVGLRSIGFKVESIEEIRRRIKSSPPFLYPGEPPISICPGPSPSPYKTFSLRDPDGNLVELAEEGWEAMG